MSSRHSRTPLKTKDRNTGWLLQVHVSNLQQHKKPLQPMLAKVVLSVLVQSRQAMVRHAACVAATMVLLP